MTFLENKKLSQSDIDYLVQLRSENEDQKEDTQNLKGSDENYEDKDISNGS